MLSNKYRVNVRKARLSLKRLKIFYIFLNRIIIVQLVIGNCYCARYFRIVSNYLRKQILSTGCSFRQKHCRETSCSNTFSDSIAVAFRYKETLHFEKFTGWGKRSDLT